MSITLMAEVWRRDVSGTEQQVLLVLCDHANDNGANCYPSVPLIAWKIGVSDRTVRRIIKDLEQRGALGIYRQDGKANNYRVNLDALEAKVPLTQLCHPRHRVTPDTAMSPHPGHNSVTPTPDTAMSSEPSVEPSLTTNQENLPRNMVRVSAPTPKRSDAQQIMDAFCEAVGIERLANYDKAGGQAKSLLKVGITAEDIPEIVEWMRTQAWLKDGFDLGTILSQADKWQTSKTGKKSAGPAGIELLPGETATETQPGHWEFSRGDMKRYLAPDYYGVIWDPNIYRGSDGTKAFRAAVERAKAEQGQHQEAA